MPEVRSTFAEESVMEFYQLAAKGITLLVIFIVAGIIDDIVRGD